jgi:hypothetical protein
MNTQKKQEPKAPKPPENVGAVDPAKKTSPIVFGGNGVCFFNDKKYSPGMHVCMSPYLMQCALDVNGNGFWRSIGSC